MDNILNSKILPVAISAFIAIFIFFISQWFLSRRNSVEFRTKKLEELYLTVNELSNQHAVRFEKIRTIANGDRSYLDDPEHIIKLYLYDINKQIIMFIRLYFPELSKTHQALFHANKEISNKIFSLTENNEINQEEFISVFVDFGDYLRDLESEIIENRKILVGENILPVAYKRQSHNKSFKPTPKSGAA